jgi:hypothetical protein
MLKVTNPNNYPIGIGLGPNSYEEYTLNPGDSVTQDTLLQIFGTTDGYRIVIYCDTLDRVPSQLPYLTVDYTYCQ